MRFCAIKHCKSNSKNHQMCHFPRAEDRREIWIKQCSLEGWTPSSHSTLCSDHFAEDAWKLTATKKKRLKSTAIPTIFSPPNKQKDLEISKKSQFPKVINTCLESTNMPSNSDPTKIKSTVVTRSTLKNNEKEPTTSNRIISLAKENGTKNNCSFADNICNTNVNKSLINGSVDSGLKLPNTAKICIRLPAVDKSIVEQNCLLSSKSDIAKALKHKVIVIKAIHEDPKTNTLIMEGRSKTSESPENPFNIIMEETDLSNNNLSQQTNQLFDHNYHCNAKQMMNENVNSKMNNKGSELHSQKVLDNSQSSEDHTDCLKVIELLIKEVNQQKKESNQYKRELIEQQKIVKSMKNKHNKSIDEMRRMLKILQKKASLSRDDVESCIQGILQRTSFLYDLK